MERLSKEEKEQTIKDKKMVSENFTTDLMGNTEGLAIQTIKMYQNYSLLEMPVARHFTFWKNWILNRDNPEFVEFNDTTNKSHKMKSQYLLLELGMIYLTIIHFILTSVS